MLGPPLHYNLDSNSTAGANLKLEGPTECGGTPGKAVTHNALTVTAPLGQLGEEEPLLGVDGVCEPQQEVLVCLR